jgi:hypothetical protein
MEEANQKCRKPDQQADIVHRFHKGYLFFRGAEAAAEFIAPLCF